MACRAEAPSEGWRNAVDSHHLPEGTHSLAPRPGTLVRLTFQNGLPRRSSESEGWSAWQDLHLQPFRLERNASALGYTRWCPRSDSHRHFARFKCAVSALDYVGKLVPREGFPPPTSPF